MSIQLDPLPPQPFPMVARHELTELRNQVQELSRENAQLKESNKMLWEQIANLRAAIRQLERAQRDGHIGPAVTEEVTE